MKCHITSYERFALTSHLVGLPSPNPEYARKRLRAWDELGVTDLADSLATGAAIGGDIQIAAWRDKKTPHLIDLSEDIMVHLIAALGGQVAGIWSDTLARVRERLERLRDKVYELPPDLRTLKAVAEQVPDAGSQMAQNKLVTFGPVALSNTLTTNILNPPTTTGGVGTGTPNPYLVLRHIRIVNKTAGAATFSLWLGATGGNVAGTEVIGTALSVPANSAYDWYGAMTIDTTQFLVGGASAATTLTFQAEGEIGIR